MAKKHHNSIRKGPGEKIFEAINYFLLAVIALSMLYPFIYVLAISLNNPNDSQLGGIWLYPRVLSFESYQIIFSDSSLLQALLGSALPWLNATVLKAIIDTVLYFINYRIQKAWVFPSAE